MQLQCAEAPVSSAAQQGVLVFRPHKMRQDRAQHISQPAEVFQCSMFAPQSKSQNAAILPFEVAVRLVQVTAKSCMNRIERCLKDSGSTLSYKHYTASL